MINKRGDIPVTILVLGVLAVCSLAIFSFYISGKNSKGEFVNIKIIEKVGYFSEEIKFYNNLEKDSFQEMKVFNEGLTMSYYLPDDIVFLGDKDLRVINGTFIRGNNRILFVKYNFDLGDE
ncbi:MAG: hypothetical protein Q8O84_05195 [Nanoarchaeota archaeon]|nr:hypothetical protein [Nanoarchaeota archaeon]